MRVHGLLIIQKTVYIIMKLDDINAIVTILKLHHTGKLIISRIEGLPC